MILGAAIIVAAMAIAIMLGITAISNGNFFEDEEKENE